MMFYIYLKSHFPIHAETQHWILIQVCFKDKYILKLLIFDYLIKKQGINVINKKEYLFDEIEDMLQNYSIKFGGKWQPELCKSDFKIAIIIPYRDRLSNLKIFLTNMHPFLIRQNIEYGVYLMEPIGNITFNRGILMNIGFMEALKDYSNNWNCFFFHDVDMIPENNYNFYKCDENTPIHYAVAVSAFNYKYIFLLF